jgi:hypothetical protein
MSIIKAFVMGSNSAQGMVICVNFSSVAVIISPWFHGLIYYRWLHVLFYGVEGLDVTLKTEHRLKAKMSVFWVVAPCSLAEVYRRFRGALIFCSLFKTL